MAIYYVLFRHIYYTVHGFLSFAVQLQYWCSSLYLIFLRLYNIIFFFLLQFWFIMISIPTPRFSTNQNSKKCIPYILSVRILCLKNHHTCSLILQIHGIFFFLKIKFSLLRMSHNLYNTNIFLYLFVLCYIPYTWPPRLL